MEASRRRHTRLTCDWSSDVCSSDLIILCLGPLKTFSYPEFFVPAHRLRHPLRERSLIKPSAYQALLTGALDYLTRLVDRYKERQGIRSEERRVGKECRHRL